LHIHYAVVVVVAAAAASDDDNVLGDIRYSRMQSSAAKRRHNTAVSPHAVNCK